MARNLSVRFALAVASGALITAVSSVPVAAAGVCPAPGTGEPGALNMAAADGGMDHAMSVDNANGNAGMVRAVITTGC
jgi:hypothetical protein